MPTSSAALDVRRVLVAGATHLPQHESELLDIVWKLVEPERGDVPLHEIMEFQALEVAHQYVPGPVLQRERFAIVHGLQEGRLQVPAGAFLLDDQFAFPEQVNEPSLPVQLDARLETRHGVDGHPEDVEEVEVETLGLALLVPGPRPLLGELPGAASDFRPGKGHVHRHNRTIVPLRGERI